MIIICLTCPGYGFTNTTKLFLRKLIAAGNTIYYFSSPQYLPYVEDTGCVFMPYEDCFEEYQNENMLEYDAYYSMKNALNQSLSQWRAQKKVIESTLDKIKRLNPDLILHDSCMYSGKRIGEVLGIKTAAVFATIPISAAFSQENYAYLSGNYFHFHPVTNSVDPGKSVKKIKRFFEMYLDEIYPIPDYFEVFQSSEDFNLIFSPRAMIPYEEKFDERYCFISPFLSYASKRKQQQLEDTPLLYISFGTSWVPKKEVVEYLYQSLGDLPVHIIFSFGGKLTKTVYGNPPQNFRVANFVDQESVLQKADLYIGSGGMTSVYEAIAHEVPMILIPFAQADHYIVADQIEAKGCGLQIHFDALAHTNLGELVIQILKDAKYRENVKKAYRSMVQPDGIEHAIERLATYAVQ